MPTLEDRWIIGFLVAVVAWGMFGLPFIYLNWQWLMHDAAGFFTFLLVVVGGLQLGLFAWQLRLIRESLDDTKIAADAGTAAANAATRQAKVAEDSLSKLERPYIFIFGVRPIFQEQRSGDFLVTYTVANFGKIPAIIEGAWIDWVISDRGEPPIPPLLHDGHDLMASPIMEAGEKRQDIKAYIPQGMSTGGVVVEIEDSGQPGRVVPEFDIPDGFDVFFRAVIHYRGPFSSGHETAALWLYNPSSFEFAIRGGEEDNYVR